MPVISVSFALREKEAEKCFLWGVTLNIEATFLINLKAYSVFPFALLMVPQPSVLSCLYHMCKENCPPFSSCFLVIIPVATSSDMSRSVIKKLIIIHIPLTCFPSLLFLSVSWLQLNDSRLAFINRGLKGHSFTGWNTEDSKKFHSSWHSLSISPFCFLHYLSCEVVTTISNLILAPSGLF